MADFYHYTSRVAAQMSMAVGHLFPGGDGFVYLTDEFYPTGAGAAKRLGIPVIGPSMATPAGIVLLTKPVEVVCVIPPERVPGLTHAQVRSAGPYREHGTGRMIYSGGGREFRYPSPVSIVGLTWLSLPGP